MVSNPSLCIIAEDKGERNTITSFKKFSILGGRQTMKSKGQRKGAQFHKQPRETLEEN